MADVKISALTENVSPAGSDVAAVSNSGATATNKVTLANIANLADPATIGAVGSDASGISGASVITNAVFLSQASYDAITPSASTLYVIT